MLNEGRRALYLNIGLNYKYVQILAQLRTALKLCLSLRLGKQYYKFNVNLKCRFCDSEEKETLTHFLFDCWFFEELRKPKLREILNQFNSEEDYILVLHSHNLVPMQTVCQFVIESLKLIDEANNLII